MQLKGKTALVTGSGRNIGRAIAIALAEEGADVVVNARSNRQELEALASEVRALGVKALPILADVGDRPQIERMAKQALDAFGHIDILVNNAAIRPNKPFLEMTYEEWRTVLSVDLDAAFLLSKTFVPAMVERKWGRIINIGGLLAFEGHAGRVHVSAAKMGLLGFTRALAKELAPHGVLVNCIVPGAIGGDSPEPGAARSARLPHIPVGRLGRPQDIASLCAFLCSDAAGFIAGQAIHVNGGERSW